MTETFFHISEIYNRKSILKNGIFPAVVKLDHHLSSFKEDSILKEDENKIIYFFLDSENNEDFFKDFVFCKTWIHPRNELVIDSDNEENWFDFSKVLNKNLYKYDQMIFDIYSIKNINEINLSYRPFHSQEPSENKNHSLYKMDDKYSHDNKVLCFSKTVEKDVNIIGQMFFEYKKNNKYNIKLIGNKYENL